MTLTENLRSSDNADVFNKCLLDVGIGKWESSYQGENELLAISTDIIAQEDDIVEDIL